MEVITTIPTEVCQNLRGIFCDIDDTLTSNGKLVDVAYQALWDAHRAGLRLVPITGRPAGWVDHLARMWPVDAVIGENGAFYFWMSSGKMHRYFVQDETTRRHYRRELERIEQAIKLEVPEAAVSADQSYREADLAIDFCEDIPRLPSEAIERIAAIFRRAGAQAKISSIHVNGWFGDFDKLSTCYLLGQNLWRETDDFLKAHYLFCGDSPNDEPMFSSFPLTVGGG